MTTAHINAQKNDFAKTVLFPGDPLRAKYIADNFFTNAKEVTNVRNMLGFTGEYQGEQISVMGSGMGIPSCSIYAHELYTKYDVESIIRIGSCGSLQDDINLHDVVVAMGASTDSNVNRTRFLGYDYAATADFSLLEKSVQAVREKNIKLHVGNILSADLFYAPDMSLLEKCKHMGVLAVEMEAAGLYGVAASLGKKALAIMTVSDHVFKQQELSSEDRQNSFNNMVEIGIKTAIAK